MIQVFITLRENTVPSVGKESLNTASIVQLIPLIFATRMNLMGDVVKTSASWAALHKSAIAIADLHQETSTLFISYKSVEFLIFQP